MRKILSLAIVFSLFSVNSFAWDNMPDEEQCPYGDAVIVNKKTKKQEDVDCINFDKKKNKWFTETILPNGEKEIKFFNPANYRVHTAMGQIAVVNGEITLID